MEQTENRINYHIEELLKKENLSERTRNVCLDESIDTLYKIVAYYFKHGDFKIIRNCGEKTNTELISLSQKYIAKYNLTPEFLVKSEGEALYEKFKFFCFDRFNVSSDQMEEFKKEFFENRLPFFKFITVVLKNLLNERELFIFENNSGFIKGKKKLTLQFMGTQFDITRERVRQISQKIPVFLQNNFIRFFEKVDYIQNHFYYNPEEKEDYVIISQRFTEAINQAENVNFTTKFYAFIFSLIYRDTHKFYFDNAKEYKSFYLIINDLTGKFDFNKYYNGLKKVIHTRTETNYPLDLQVFIEKFATDSSKETLNRAFPLCKRIANDEFGLTIEDNKFAIIPRNTLKKLSEYIIEILADYGRPMHLNEIRYELDRRTIKSPPNIESLRSSILSIRNLVAIGKTSTYSLADWGAIKTGTIKKLVSEYLNQFDEPKSIADITEYICQFRKTTDKNILSNLKLDKKDIFVFFKGGLIGITTKTYNMENVKPE